MKLSQMVVEGATLIYTFNSNGFPILKFIQTDLGFIIDLIPAFLENLKA